MDTLNQPNSPELSALSACAQASAEAVCRFLCAASLPLVNLVEFSASKPIASRPAIVLARRLVRVTRIEEPGGSSLALLGFLPRRSPHRRLPSRRR